MSFKNFGKRKKRKNPVVSHLACTTGFFRLLFKFIISSPRFTSLHDNLEVITTLQDDILQEV